MNPSLALALVLLVQSPAATTPPAGPALDLPVLTDRAVQDFKDAMSRAHAAGSDERSTEAIAAFQRAAAIHATNEGLWYDLACTYALAGKKDDALAALRKASDAGWSDPVWPTKDTDLASLQDVMAFKQWLDTLKSAPPADLALGELATEPDAITKLGDAAAAKLDRLRGVLGSTESSRETRRIALWRAASWDKVAASRDGQGKVDAEMEALRGLTRKDFTPKSQDLIGEVERRASAFVTAHPRASQAQSAELMSALASWQGSGGGDDENAAEAANKTLERRLLVLAASHDDGPAVRAALVRLLGLTDDPVAQRSLYGRLQTSIPDEAERRALVADGARGAWYRFEGLPPFEARTLDGTIVTPAALKGKVTLVDFWATWCGPCKAELPNVKAAWKRFHGDDFQIIGVSLDKAKDGDPTEFKKWCADNGVDWPQIFDGKHWDSALAKTFSVHGIPFPLLLDRNAQVIASDEDLRGDKLIPTIESAIGSHAMGGQ